MEPTSVDIEANFNYNMPETVLWDTAAFVALEGADDALHEQAVQADDALARQMAALPHFA